MGITTLQIQFIHCVVPFGEVQKQKLRTHRCEISDVRFNKFRQVLDSEMKRLKATERKSADVITNEMEDRLWGVYVLTHLKLSCMSQLLDQVTLYNIQRMFQ